MNLIQENMYLIQENFLWVWLFGFIVPWVVQLGNTKNREEFKYGNRASALFITIVSLVPILNLFWALTLLENLWNFDTQRWLRKPLFLRKKNE